MSTKKMNQVALDAIRGTATGVSAPRDLVDLERLLRSSREVMVTILPHVAEAILAQWNLGNRTRNEIDVQRYRRDMDAGRWQSGREIGFGVCGDVVNLGNGQHRMAAQVASGTTQTYHAVSFDDQDEFELYVLTCDQNRPRSLSNILQIFGVAEGSGASRLYENITNAMNAFFGGKSSRMSTPERFDFAKGFLKPIRFVLKLPKKMFKAHVLAAIALAHAKQPRIVEDVVATMISGANMDEGSAAHAIDRSLSKLNGAKKFEDKDKMMALILRAMFDASTGKKRTTVNHVRTEASTLKEAVTYFCGHRVADDWAKRQEDRRLSSDRKRGVGG